MVAREIALRQVIEQLLVQFEAIVGFRSSLFLVEVDDDLLLACGFAPRFRAPLKLLVLSDGFGELFAEGRPRLLPEVENPYKGQQVLLAVKVAHYFVLLALHLPLPLEVDKSSHLSQHRV